MLFINTILGEVCYLSISRIVTVSSLAITVTLPLLKIGYSYQIWLDVSDATLTLNRSCLTKVKKTWNEMKIQGEQVVFPPLPFVFSVNEHKYK